MPLSNAPVLSVYLTTTGATRANWGARIRPFGSGEKLAFWSTGAATVYGCDYPGRNAPGRAFRYRGDGSTTSFTLPTAATGVTYPTTNAASLAASNYLQAIVLSFTGETNGSMETSTMLERVGSDGSPSGTQWLINGTTVTFATAPAVGTVVEILIPDTALIFELSGGALTANKEVVLSTYDFLTTGVAAVNVLPIQR